MNENLITKAYEMAKERYAAIGVDTDKAIELLEKTPISLQCWQADDVMGFENDTALTGGIQGDRQLPWPRPQHRRAPQRHQVREEPPRWNTASEPARDLR